MTEHHRNDQPASAAPGWYPTGPNEQRFWDGTVWTDHAAPLNPATPMSGPWFANPVPDTSLAALSHLLGLFTGFVGPLAIYVARGDDDPFVRHHAAEALNFQLSFLIFWVSMLLLAFFVIGFGYIVPFVLIPFVFATLATIKTRRGEWYRYPISVRFVR